MIIEDMNLKIPKGKITIIIGANGCGKSTLLKVISRILPAKRGEVRIDGMDLCKEKAEYIAKKVAVLPQTPTCPDTITVRELVSYGRVPYRKAIGGMSRHDIEQVDWALEKTGLTDISGRLVTELSGGQRQRICIARALALNPEFVVCDEPVSALDVSIQAQIINLLKELQEKYSLTYLFISHDLSVVEYISDTVGVMYLGNLVEYGTTEDIFRNPLHPYTEALFSAIPIPDPEAKMNRIVLEGSIPSPANPPEGCKFHTRCAHCMERCKHEAPVQKEVEPGHYVVCHLYDK